MNTSPTKIVVKDFISADLALRSSADRLFQFISSSPGSQVMIDFKGIRSITRSFAHQYFLRMKECFKTITEINMPDNVRKMFDVVKEPRERSRVINPATVKVVSL